MEVATDKKRAREGEDGAAAAASVEGAVVPEPANGAPEDVERAEVKRPKIDEAASGATLMDVEEKKIVESEIVDTVVAKDGEWVFSVARNWFWVWICGLVGPDNFALVLTLLDCLERRKQF